MTVDQIMVYLQEAGANGGVGLISALAGIKLFVSSKLKAANAGVAEAKALVAETKANAQAELEQVKNINTETTLAANDREIARLDLALSNKYITPEARELYATQKVEILAQVATLKASKIAAVNTITNVKGAVNGAVDELKSEVADTIKNVTTGWL